MNFKKIKTIPNIICNLGPQNERITKNMLEAVYRTFSGSWTSDKSRRWLEFEYLHCHSHLSLQKNWQHEGPTFAMELQLGLPNLSHHLDLEIEGASKLERWACWDPLTVQISWDIAPTLLPLILIIHQPNNIVSLAFCKIRNRNRNRNQNRNELIVFKDSNDPGSVPISSRSNI